MTEVLTPGLRRRLEAYGRDLEFVGATDRDLSGSYPASVVLRWAFREGLSLLLGLPLALCGMILHAMPYGLTASVVRALHPADEDGGGHCPPRSSPDSPGWNRSESAKSR